MTHAAIGEQGPVARIVAPAENELVGVELGGVEHGSGDDEAVAVVLFRDDLLPVITVVADPLARLIRAALAGDERGALCRDPEPQRLELRDRIAVVDAERQGLRGEIGRCRHELCDIAVSERHRARNAIDVGVRVGVREAVDLRVTAGVQVERDALAGAEEVAVGVVAVEDEGLGLGIADAAAELGGRTFLDLELDIDEIRRTRHRLGLGLHLLDERQPL